MRHIMARYAKANQTTDDLMDKIESEGGVHEVVWSPRVVEDLAKVNFDLENLESFDSEDAYTHLPGLKNLGGYQMLGWEGAQFPALWCAAGGDWELPLVFILYIGAKGEIRAYIPENGNAYNHEKKAAYGNNEGDPVYGDDDPRYVFDLDAMHDDIIGRIEVKG